MDFKLSLRQYKTINLRQHKTKLDDNNIKVSLQADEYNNCISWWIHTHTDIW